jgi:hypothetical protein
MFFGGQIDEEMRPLAVRQRVVDQSASVCGRLPKRMPYDIRTFLLRPSYCTVRKASVRASGHSLGEPHKMLL